MATIYKRGKLWTITYYEADYRRVRKAISPNKAVAVAYLKRVKKRIRVEKLEKVRGYLKI